MKVVGAPTNLRQALHETLTDVCTQDTFLKDFLEPLIFGNVSWVHREENVFADSFLTPVCHWPSFHMGNEFPSTSEVLSGFLGSFRTFLALHLGYSPEHLNSGFSFSFSWAVS